MDLLGPAAIPWPDLVWRLGLAAAFGFVAGLDREIRGFSAGVRTHMLVALSSAATMLIALELQRQVQSADPSRAIQGLAQAIGFLCAGVIFVSRGAVRGLTTAASLWMTSALGMAAGAGFIRIALVGLVAAVAVISLLWLIERVIERRRWHRPVRED